MSKNLADRVFVVVADGTRARFFHLQSGPSETRLVDEGVLHVAHLVGEGPSGKSPPERSHHETDEATFAKQVARELYRRAHDREFTSLILIADPQTLGQIRPQLHKEVSSRVTREVAKTLTNASHADILDAVAA